MIRAGRQEALLDFVVRDKQNKQVTDLRPDPEILYLPFGIVGLFHNLRRKKIGDAYSPSV